MKKFIRTLSMLVCVALLMTTVPVETLLDLCAYAEDEVVQAIQLPDEDSAPAPEQAPVEQNEDEVPVEEPAQVPEAEVSEAPAEIPVTEPSGEPVQDDGDEVTAQQTASAEPVAEVTMEPEATEDPYAINYAADAGKNPVFVLGYAEILQNGTDVYDEDDSAKVKAEIGKGVVYVFARSADPDRLQIAFHVGVPELDTGWVNAEDVRPMDPAVELHPYFLSCEGVENLLFYNNIYDLPLKVIECAYAEAEVEETPAATEEPEIEATPEPTEEAAPEATEEPEVEATPEPTEEPEAEATPEPTEEVQVEATEEPSVSVEDEILPEDTGAALLMGSTLELMSGEVLSVPESISVAETTIYLSVNQTGRFVQGICPDGTACEFIYESLNKDVAEVDAQTGAITAKAVGEAIVTVTAQNNAEATVNCLIMVVEGPSSIQMGVGTLKMGVGNTYDLLNSGLIQTTPANVSASYTFKTSDSRYVSVNSDGLLTAKRAGTITITVTSNTGKKATMKVQVQNAAKSVTLSPASIELGVEMTGKLNVAFPSKTYSIYELVDTNPGVVSIDENGNVTAKAAGTTTIQVKTLSGLEAASTITVHAMPENISPVQERVIVGVSEPGKRVQGAYPNGTMCEFTYKSLNEEVAFVDPVSGAITALKVGEAEVEITSANSKASKAKCVVQVVPAPEALELRSTSISLGVKDTFNLLDAEYIENLPLNSSASYTFKSSNTKYVKVTADGEITGVRAGSATVTVTSHNKKSVKLTVRVYNRAKSATVEPLVLGEEMTRSLSVSFPKNTYSTYTLQGYDGNIIAADNYGRITGVKAGETAVNVVFSGIATPVATTVKVLPMPGADQISMIEKSMKIGVGEKGKSVSAIYADGTMCEFTYSSSDESKLKVHPLTGELTAIAEGTVTVTATTRNSAAHKTSCEVNVVPAPDAISLNESLIKLGSGNSFDLLNSGIIENIPATSSASYTFKTSNSKYVTVNSQGVLTAKKNGTVTITVTSHNGKKDTIKVQVLSAPKWVELELDGERVDSKTLGVEMRDQLSVVFPSKTYNLYEVSISGDEGVLKLGADNVLTAVKPGKATITVTAKVNSNTTRTDSIDVTVVPMPESITAAQSRIVLGVSEPGKRVQGAYPNGTMCEFMYKSLNEEVAFVDPVSGAITALKVGEAEVEITSANSKASKAKCVVQVVPAPEALELRSTSISLGVKDTFNLLDAEYIENLPLNSSASYTFKSSNTKYVKVTADGEITGVRAGSATVTVTSHNKKSVKLTVRVYNRAKSATVEPLVLGEEMTRSLSVSFPKNTYSTYTLQGYDGNIIAADSYGRITGVKAGETAVNVVFSGIATPVATTVKVLPMPGADQISMIEKSMKIGVGEKGKSVSAVYVDGTMCEFTYSSSDESKLKVHPLTGELTAIAEGTVTITATTRNSAAHKTTCEVNVVPAPDAISLNESLIKLGNGNSFDLLNSGIIENIPATSSASYTFKTSNSKYVAVNSQGVLTAKKNGTVTITVTSHNGKKDTIKVQVLSAPKWVELELDGERVDSKTLGVEMRNQLSVVFPSKTYNLYEVSISGDEGVLKLGADNVLTAVKPGKATITVTARVNSNTTRTDSIDVTVVPMPESITAAQSRIVLGVSEPGKRVQGAYPNGTMCEFTYKSLNEEVAFVDPVSGAITALKVGEAEVEITSANSKASKAKCTVQVVPAPEALELRSTSISLGVKDTFNLLDAEYIENLPLNSSASYTFKSSNTKYVKVTADGEITGVRAGSATVTVTSHNKKSVKLTVRVYNRAKSATVEPLVLGEEMTRSLSVSFPKNTYSTYTLQGYDGNIIAADNYGRITGVKAGETAVNVVFSGIATPVATTVKVLPMPGADQISMIEKSMRIGVGEKGKSVSAVYVDGTMCEFTYSSSDESKLKVHPLTGELTAIAEGTVTVTATTRNSAAHKTSCEVNVVPAPDAISLSESLIKLGSGNSFDLLNSGIIEKIPATSSASYTFKTSNSKYVTVNSQGVLTAKKNGTVTITVTSHNGKKDTIKVQVLSAPKWVELELDGERVDSKTLGVEMRDQLSVVFPSKTYNLYEVSISGDEGVLKLGADNVLTAVKPGKATITVTARVNSNTTRTDSIDVTVVPAPTSVAFEKSHYTVAAEGMSLQVLPVINDGSMASYTFSSSDNSIATIDDNGVITGLKGGEVTITVETQNKVKNTAKVTVTPAPAELVYEDLSTIVIAKGDSVELPVPIALDANQNECPSTFTYKSSNTKVAKVSGNKVTGVAAGTVTITVSSYNNKTTTFKLTVSSKAITGVDLSVKEKTLYVNDQGYTESVQIGASIVGSGLNEGSLKYTSSDAAVAVVSADGLVTAKAPGTATITASAFNGKSAPAAITVLKLSSSLAFAKTEERMTEQKTLQLEPIFENDTSAPVSYQTSDASIAVVDESGLVTALRPGDVTISGIVDVEGEETRFDLSASVKVHIIAAPKNIFLNVTGVNLMVNESITLEPKLEADAAEFDNTITFESSDPWVATVDSTTGAVTAVGAGNTVITAKTCNGLTATCDVSVVAEGETPKVGFSWEDEATITAGDSTNLEISLNKAAFERGFTIASSDPTKLSVDMDELTIHALAAGTVDLTMTINPVEGEESVVSDTCKITIIEGTQIAFSATELELRALSSATFADSSAELKIINPHKNLIGTYSLTIEDESLIFYDEDAGIVQALETAGVTRIVIKTYNQEVACTVTVINRPTYRALIIGEFNNSGASNDLPFVANNTNAMEKVLEASVIDGEEYAKVVKKANNPTKTQIQSAINDTFGDAREGDVSVLYIVSHGYDVAANGGYHFGIYNYSKSNPATYVRHSDLMDWLSPIKGNVVLVLDSCKSGAFIRDAKSRLEAEGNIAVITAQNATKNASFYQGTTTGTQVEFLTYTFCEGLGYVYSDKSTGKPKWLGSIPADGSPTDGEVTVKEILSYTDKNVPTLVAEYMKTFTNGKSKFRVPGVYTTSALKSWGGQDPQVFMPYSMEDVVVFGY